MKYDLGFKNKRIFNFQSIFKPRNFQLKMTEKKRRKEVREFSILQSQYQRNMNFLLRDRFSINFQGVNFAIFKQKNNKGGTNIDYGFDALKISGFD